MSHDPFAPYPPPPTRPPARFRIPIVPLLILAFLLFYLYREFFRTGTPAVDPRPITPAGNLADEEKSTIALFKRISPSVVYITTLSQRFDLFRRNIQEMPSGTGSGLVWDNAGHIVTNFHVVQRASSAQITLNDHTTYPADFVGTAPNFDLAVLRIRAPKDKLRPIPDIGSSQDLQVGQKVFAIGNPFGLDQTLTTGIVSALGRTIPAVTGREIEDVIQTDAAINPGNSGGPLLDSTGRLIGVNTAIFSPSGASAGIGFAVPVDVVNRIVPQLVQKGKLQSYYTGISIDDQFSQRILRPRRIEGVLILGVRPGSPAAEAGLRGTQRDPDDGSIIPGDIIQEVNGRKVRSQQDFTAELQRHDPGQTVTLTIRRGSEVFKVKLRLQPAPE